MKFEVKKQINALNRGTQMMIILEIYLPETEKIVWVSGDDLGCAVTEKDFITQKNVNYKDVLIYENIYGDTSPEDAGNWYPLIEEMVGRMVDKYLEHFGVAHVYPQWVPEKVRAHFGEDLFNQMIQNCAYITVDPIGLSFEPKKQQSKEDKLC